MNNINLIGRITKDTELKKTMQGVAFISFVLAVKRKKEGADFINCVAFGKPAELIHTYCKKGTQIGVSGRLEVNSKQEASGEWKTYTNVVVEELTFTEKKEQEQQEDVTEEIGKAIFRKEEPKKEEALNMFEEFEKNIFTGF